MSSTKDGIMIILSSPSGAGKTTLVKLLAEKKIIKYLFPIPQENLEKMKFQVKIIFLLMKKILKI